MWVNVFPEPVGLERLKESLEANDWAGGEVEENPDLGDGSDESFGVEAAEMEKEIFGLKEAINDSDKFTPSGDEELDVEDQDEEVEKLQQMMVKMQAVRGEG